MENIKRHLPQCWMTEGFELSHEVYSRPEGSIGALRDVIASTARRNDTDLSGGFEIRFAAIPSFKADVLKQRRYFNFTFTKDLHPRERPPDAWYRDEFVGLAESRGTSFAVKYFLEMISPLSKGEKQTVVESLLHP